MALGKYIVGALLLTVYLGGYDKEDKAARAYDLAALKYWGSSTTINFPVMCAVRMIII
jgi:hypothetical protein